MRLGLLPIALLGGAAVLAARAAPPSSTEASRGGPETTDARPPPGLPPPPRLANRAAYVPSQCFTKTRDDQGHVHNPCYVCHTRSTRPNYVDDDDLQLHLALPVPAAHNPWTNLFDPPAAGADRLSDDAILAYVRQDNYFDDKGEIALATSLPAGFTGFVPDVRFAFDDAGFDHRPDGSYTDWRAFAYYPFPGTFFPTNGSADDVLVRLSAPFRETDDGRFDINVYIVNLAVVEALERRADVAIDPVDEARLGADLDLDGHVRTASRVAFDPARMRYVGRARGLQERGTLHLAAGMVPEGTELFHTVRYLDVAPNGDVTMAPRMKEARYMRKDRWSSDAIARAHAARETQEQDESPDGTHDVKWYGDRGVFTNGWLVAGFIEDTTGALRPQTYEETAFCEGCHGGLGVTTDSTFSLARKLADGPARGWTHWSQRGLRGLPEPRQDDGVYEYTRYLQENGAGDELRDNDEVLARFFDGAGALKPEAVARLHDDVAELLLPTPARALDLDRAYRAIVRRQSFAYGRDAVLSPSCNVYAAVKLGQDTGIGKALTAHPLRTHVAAEASPSVQRNVTVGKALRL